MIESWGEPLRHSAESDTMRNKIHQIPVSHVPGPTVSPRTGGGTRNQTGPQRAHSPVKAEATGVKTNITTPSPLYSPHLCTARPRVPCLCCDLVLTPTLSGGQGGCHHLHFPDEETKAS